MLQNLTIELVVQNGNPLDFTTEGTDMVELWSIVLQLKNMLSLLHTKKNT